MAIVDMKKMTLLAAVQDRGRLLRLMQKLGCVEVIEQDAEEKAQFSHSARDRMDELNKEVSRLDQAILKLGSFDKSKKKFLEGKPIATDDQIMGVQASRGDLFDIVDRIEDIERARGELRSQETRLNALIDQLTPWLKLDIPLSQIRNTKTSMIELLALPSRNYDGFKEQLSNAGTAVVKRIGLSGDNLCVFLAVHLSEADVVENAMKAFSVTHVSFPDMKGTPQQAAADARASINEIEKARNRYEQELFELAAGLTFLRLLRDLEATELSRLEAQERCLQTKSAFLLTGWVPAHKTKELEEKLKKTSPSCEVEFANAPDDEIPPTLLSNKKGIAPFESIVKMFSMPDPHGLDPTFIMMPFWICFFGMMVSDAGYGIILAVAATFVCYKLKGRGSIGKITAVVALGGLATVFWGALYGSWFSIEGIKPLLFAPMDKPLEMMILCLAIGGVHIFTGMGIAAYMNIKRGKPLDALYDQGFWMILLIGLLMFLVNSTIGAVLSLTGFFGVLLTAGRGKSKNPLKRILSGLGSLYGISGYISDILSYARLFGMGLATGVIGMVFNTLATMVMGSPVGIIAGILILIVGHSLNLAINTLGAYVHSCRLQYIEFFSKFYESGGVDFMPLEECTKYVELSEG